MFRIHSTASKMARAGTGLRPGRLSGNAPESVPIGRRAVAACSELYVVFIVNHFEIGSSMDDLPPKYYTIVLQNQLCCDELKRRVPLL